MSYLLDFLTPLKDGLGVLVSLRVQLICSSRTHVFGSLCFLVLGEIERTAKGLQGFIVSRLPTTCQIMKVKTKQTPKSSALRKTEIQMRRFSSHLVTLPHFHALSQTGRCKPLHILPFIQNDTWKKAITYCWPWGLIGNSYLLVFFIIFTFAGRHSVSLHLLRLNR